ncbi:ribosomal protein S18-alanine N-acetyltransferase [Aurantimonas sp. Leaf443]|uniref:ribosomal protein S18-alanine N-acetyltransferase n=1 Tax=Aurantimonas sp. Leaf443 TaxID=1736378 RepID=UPI0006F25977|nr:ribosomal protein S18-alanine N-acetyltransferase [Aurantimonas sp. Leaf443]KQT83939.1 ribosomal-protein-alanine acetyltransferase [Aurantimonas sp. Leaf443]
MYWYLPFVWTLSFWEGLTGGGPPQVAPLEDADLDEAAEIHSQAFDRAWTGEELAALLRQSGSFGFVVKPTGGTRRALLGFVLARLTQDEAEILTIAVSKGARGQGIGRMLMDAVLRHLHAERATSLFLEVDEENIPARKLYARLRFEEVGRRPAYYKGKDGRRTSAFVLKRTFER